MNMSQKLKDLTGRINAIGPEIESLGKKADRNAEEDGKLDTLIVEFTDLREQAEREIKAIRAQEQFAQMRQSVGSVTEAVAANERDGLVQGGAEPAQVDRRSIGQRFAQSDVVKDWLRSGGHGDSKRFTVSREKQAAQAPVRYDGNGPVNRMALIETGVFPSFMPAPQVLPDIIRPRDYALNMRSVIASGTTTSDTIYFLRELAFTNNAAETAQATSHDPAAVGTSGAKPESSLTFEEASTAVKTIAHWVPITRQAIADVPQLQSYVENRLLVGLERRLNSQIANGTGSGATLTGILQTSGIQDLDDAYFSAATPPINDAASQNANANRIARAQTVIDVVADAQATFVALNPYDFEKFKTSTDANRQYFGGGPFQPGGFTTIWGLPAVSERAITQGTALVGDGTMAMVFDREEANILIGYINAQFIQNMLTILAEMRAALAVFRPAAFAKVELLDA